MSAVKELFAGMAAQAGRYDVTEQALARSRRIRTRRRITGGAGALALVVVLASAFLLRGHPASTPEPAVPTPSASPAPAAFPTRCAVERLALPGGKLVGEVTGADPSGRFVLGLAGRQGDGAHRPILIWDNGVPAVVELPGVYGRLVDVTTAGLAVGHSFVDGELAAWTYHDGTVSRLPGVDAEPRAVNEQGVVVGAAGVTGQASGPSRKLPVVWRSAAQPPQTLPGASDGWSGMATAVDEDGTIVGYRQPSRDGSSRREPLRWHPDGSMHQLPFDVAITGSRATSAYAAKIRHGWITGFGTAPVQGRQVMAPLLWAPGATQPVAEDGTGRSDINAQGWVARVYDGELVMTSLQQRVALPLLPDGVVSPDADVLGIGDDGRLLAGNQLVAGVGNAPVRWRCG